ncbi:MAG: Epoxide hydrolase [uncultured Arthrobacter sp.]|uniref:Epoxide hydrolase n=1 Tax=uncultured Arthrobacter sp. TaxID=114050 RepID=A0A6J4J846_9MICC|nr:epoxide hydrolase family protein [uncultured Arthrobacter sp.]CAA9270550.1 MAG: Epoxide hydrolase [uncultured Arthrobacter sp.]
MTLTPSPPAATPTHILGDLRDRLHRFRTVATAVAGPWARGVDADYLQDLIGYWATEYEWTVHEQRIRELPWVQAGKRWKLRLIHQTAEDPTATAVVLLHGWPDSVLRFERVLPLLTDLNVIVPALPGFPFALPIAEGGLSSEKLADAVADAIADLGYDRYVISAGDVGCDVAEALAANYPERVAALHLTDVSQYHFLVGLPTDLSDAEKEYVRDGHHWQATEGGYMHEQSTKPQTIAAALGDSPAGLAAWILEKLRTWTDSGGDVETIFSRDELLTWITAYWVTDSIGTSFTPYAESGAKPWGRIQAPTSFTVFPRDLVNAPREFADRFFNVQDWQEYPVGGHFAAWEQPEEYIQGIRSAVQNQSGGSD